MPRKPPLRPDDLAEEVQKIDAALVEGTDLAAALTATAFLDEALLSLLAVHLRQGSTSEAMLGSGRGVLGTYSARADLAYCLGLIDKPALQALRQVAEVRNAFAHSYGESSFAAPAVKQLVESLKYPYERHLKQWSHLGERDKVKKALDDWCSTPRNRFTYTCVLLGQAIIHAAQDAKRVVQHEAQ